MHDGVSGAGSIHTSCQTAPNCCQDPRRETRLIVAARLDVFSVEDPKTERGAYLILLIQTEISGSSIVDG